MMNRKKMMLSKKEVLVHQGNSLCLSQSQQGMSAKERLATEISGLREDIAGLRVKYHLVERIIREAIADGDPRYENAVETQRAINQKLVACQWQLRQILGQPEPPAVVVGLKPASMDAKRESANQVAGSDRLTELITQVKVISELVRPLPDGPARDELVEMQRAANEEIVALRGGREDG